MYIWKKKKLPFSELEQCDSYPGIMTFSTQTVFIFLLSRRLFVFLLISYNRTFRRRVNCMQRVWHITTVHWIPRRRRTTENRFNECLLYALGGVCFNSMNYSDFDIVALPSIVCVCVYATMNFSQQMCLYCAFFSLNHNILIRINWHDVFDFSRSVQFIWCMYLHRWHCIYVKWG